MNSGITREDTLVELVEFSKLRKTGTTSEDEMLSLLGI